MSHLQSLLFTERFFAELVDVAGDLNNAIELNSKQSEFSFSANCVATLCVVSFMVNVLGYQYSSKKRESLLEQCQDFETTLDDTDQQGLSDDACSYHHRWLKAVRHLSGDDKAKFKRYFEETVLGMGMNENGKLNCGMGGPYHSWPVLRAKKGLQNIEVGTVLLDLGTSAFEDVPSVILNMRILISSDGLYEGTQVMTLLLSGFNLLKTICKAYQLCGVLKTSVGMLLLANLQGM